MQVLKRICQGIALALICGACPALALAGPQNVPDVPELALGSLVGALTLVTGGVLIFAGRRRR